MDQTITPTALDRVFACKCGGSRYVILIYCYNYLALNYEASG